MGDNEYILRLEIARLLQRQRELQLREMDSFYMRTLEAGAETKARSHIQLQKIKTIVQDPMSHPPFKAHIEKLQGWISSWQTAANTPTSSMAPQSATIEDAEVRSISKIELLEKQLEELKKLIELQQQASSMISTRNSTPTHAVINNNEMSSASHGLPRPPASTESTANQLGQSGWTEGAPAVTPARPKMTDIMAAAKNVQLKKVSAVGIAGSSQRRPVADGGGGLAGILRSAMDKRFQHIHRTGANVSPASESGSEGTSSPFGSPSTPRATRDRRLTTSASMVAAASAARRSSKVGLECPIPEDLRQPQAPATPPQKENAQLERVHDFSPLSPPSEADEPARKKAGLSLSSGLLSDIGKFNKEALQPTAQKEGASDENTGGAPAKRPAPVSMLSAIKGFDKSALKTVSANAQTDAAPPVAAPKAGPGTSKSVVSPPPFRPTDAIKVQLKKTGAKLT